MLEDEVTLFLTNGNSVERCEHAIGSVNVFEMHILKVTAALPVRCHSDVFNNLVFDAQDIVQLVKKV